ncbi:MAG: FMN-binding glutamate synthase family protein [Thermoleophilia bacterium]|nr:FMN-binding glutamate synthase family protein [Thermoleophilia bacterium]
MTLTPTNRSGATGSRTRLGDDVNPQSGLCAVCQDDCPGYCEVAQSALRGAEMLYPQPYGHMTAAAQKDYPVDYSHLSIMGTAVGAHGIAADSDVAIFPNVEVSTRLGHDQGIELQLPIVVPGLGSTDVARRHWEGLAAGAAISGVMLTIGENVVGMDEEARLEGGGVVDAPELRRRVEFYRRWARGKGAVVVQENVEDSRLGVLEYAVRELGVRAVELKWGQGAKDIGGEVKISSMEKARMLRERGYLVLPDPAGHEAQLGFGKAFNEFERHSRVGMVSAEGFHERVGRLRQAGARYVFLKTGAYRLADLARAVKYASEAKLDLLTVDGAGGGTGMSPWRMMNEWGVPTFYLEALTYGYAKRLADRGEHVPAIAIAGGFSMEDHLFKAIAMGAPYVKMVGMARAALTAAMSAKFVGQLIDEANLPKHVLKHGHIRDQVFTHYVPLQEEYADVGELPDGAVGVYGYMTRLAQGLRQLMAGSRKFRLEALGRADLTCLSRDATEISGIPYVMDVDSEEVDSILEG